MCSTCQQQGKSLHLGLLLKDCPLNPCFWCPIIKSCFNTFWKYFEYLWMKLSPKALKMEGLQNGGVAEWAHRVQAQSHQKAPAHSSVSVSACSREHKKYSSLDAATLPHLDQDRSHCRFILLEVAVLAGQGACQLPIQLIPFRYVPYNSMSYRVVSCWTAAWQFLQ